MDAAIRSTNAQYDDPEILNHLDVRLMSPCDGDIGWDILSLQYTVRGPLATMLEPSMRIYQVLFKPLWRMKHMEFVLSSKIWKDQKCNSKVRTIKDLFVSVQKKVRAKENVFSNFIFDQKQKIKSCEGSFFLIHFPIAIQR